MEELYTKLINLFTQIGEKHHNAYQETDGFDPEWPTWYAEHMHADLRGLLESDFTRSELIYLIITAQTELQIESPGINWKDYYANFFIDRYY